MSGQRVLSLFAGIGGIDLGLERIGCVTTAYSEIDPYASRVMQRHFPTAVNVGDITTVDWSEVQREHGPFDIICGGFPCQDISLAGKGAGITDGTRSGLWANYADAIRVLRPQGVLVENVAALTSRGLDRVLGDLAACGYDAEWDCIPAAAVGAPHLRDRIFIVAYRTDADTPGRRQRAVADACSEGRRQNARSAPGNEGANGWRTSADNVASGTQSVGADANRDCHDADCGLHAERAACGCDWDFIDADGFCACCHAHIDDPRGLYAAQPFAGHCKSCTAPHATGEGFSFRAGEQVARSGEITEPERCGSGWAGTTAASHADGERREERDRATLTMGSKITTARRASRADGWPIPRGSEWWSAEPDVGRVAHGIPKWVDRLRCLGNAVVPQVAEHVGRILLARMNAQPAHSATPTSEETA